MLGSHLFFLLPLARSTLLVRVGSASTLLTLDAESQGLGCSSGLCRGSGWWQWECLEPADLLSGPGTSILT